MVKIAAELPLNEFAGKIAERTGLTLENVTHVLATALVVAGEDSGRDAHAVHAAHANDSFCGHSPARRLSTPGKVAER